MTTCRILMILAAAAIVVAGCDDGESGLEGAGNNGLLLSDQAQRIPDVPIPLDFDLVESRSRHFAVGDTRFIDHLYKGYADKLDTANFYSQRMPTTRWKLVDRDFLQGTYELTFRKGTEKCEIRINGDGNIFSPTKLIILVKPASDQELAPMAGYRSPATAGSTPLP